MGKRTNAALWYGFAGLIVGLLTFSRWGLFSLLGFYPTDLCNSKIAESFFRQGGKIDRIIADKIKQDSIAIDCVFVNAVKYQNLSSLQPLIDSGADVNVKDKKGQTPLFFVRSEKIARLLIDNDANVKAENNRGQTPLFFAQSREIARLLVDNGANINARDIDKQTPLFIHVDDLFSVTDLYKENDNNFKRVHDLEVVKFLIENGANINARNWNDSTPLFFARNKTVAQLLIENGAEINVRKEDSRGESNKGNTPLFGANTKGIAKLLIENGADIEARNSRGETALASFVSGIGVPNSQNFQLSRKEIIETLIENGADIDAQDSSGKTPLGKLVDRVRASQYSYNSFAPKNEQLGLWLEAELSLNNTDLEIIQILIDSGADVNAKDKNNETILFGVTHPIIAKILIENGADVNAKDRSGDTILYYKILMDAKEVAQLLIQNGADLNIELDSGRNLLFIAKSPEMAQLLIENGADVNAKDKSGKTPLFFAESLEIVRLLVENGAEVNTKDKHGETPLFRAKSKEVAQVLIENGADVNTKNKRGKTILSTIEFSLKFSQQKLEQLEPHNSLAEERFQKIEIDYHKQKIAKSKELIAFLVESGAI